MIADPDCPKIGRAINGGEWKSKWLGATQREFATLTLMSTFRQVMYEDIAKDADIYPTKMVYTQREILQQMSSC
jgi:hypothetical protein